MKLWSPAANRPGRVFLSTLALEEEVQSLRDAITTNQLRPEQKPEQKQRETERERNTRGFWPVVNGNKRQIIILQTGNRLTTSLSHK